jgi:Domain of unknown function (DUF4124)
MSSRTTSLVFGLVLGLTALLLATPAAAGKVYQWKDAKGVTHFSDSPPPDQQSYKNRQLKDSSAPPEQIAENPNCVTARKNLEQLKSDKPVGLDANGDGKPDKEMTAEERGHQVQLAELTLKAYCTKSEPQAGTH